MPEKKPPLHAPDAKYLFITVVTRRAKELARTGRPTIPYQDGNFDPVEVAKEELFSNKLTVRCRNKLTNELENFEDMP